MKKMIFPFILFCLFLLTTFFAHAQNEIVRDEALETQCGDILEGEFTSNYQEQTYAVTLASGDSLSVSATPLGGNLGIGIIITGPTNLGIGASAGGISGNGNIYNDPSSEPRVVTSVLSARGIYTLRVTNFGFATYWTDSDGYSYLSNPAGIGIYNLYVSCTLRDGTIIEAGDTVPSDDEGQGCLIASLCGELGDEGDNSQTLVPDFGFPGLEPVDFASAFRVPFTFGTSTEGEIPATGDGVLGFRFDGTAGDTLDLSFERTSGNLNLGLLVLSAENQVAYMAALVSSSTMSTNLTLPSTSEYTIGVFRLDLIPPAAPEATGFQITAALNP